MLEFSGNEKNGNASQHPAGYRKCAAYKNRIRFTPLQRIKMAKKLHFVGIGGNGMSALAQIHAMSGDTVTGSDRLLDKGYASLPLWEKLKALGIGLFAQDGNAITKDLDAVIFSSAIEDDNPDSIKTKELGLKTIHRSELLSEHVSSFKTVAVSGTSGKSTVTAMIYEILQRSGCSPSVITGAPIISLQDSGLLGNVSRGKSDILVIEADESDGSLVNYRPDIGLMLNLTKDHKELDILYAYFRKFKANCARFLVNADEKNLSEFAKGSMTFGLEKGDTRAENVRLEPFRCLFTVKGVEFTVPEPGLYNVQNSIAAIAAAVNLGVSLEDCAKSLAKFKGVARRFNSIGTYNGIEVIDDFAHNPAKISAAMSAAHLRGKRVLAFYQPHGYAPVKLLKNELIEAFAASLNAEDIIWFPEIYYIGGTVSKDVSSKDIVGPLRAKGKNANFTASREEIISEIAKSAKPGDVVIVMGARDPTLTDYARLLFNAISH